MALGSNLKFDESPRVWARISKLMGWGYEGANKAGPTVGGFVAVKLGIPATNTANDNPGKRGVFILDGTNNDVYICSAYTNGTTFTITKLT